MALRCVAAAGFTRRSSWQHKRDSPAHCPPSPRRAGRHRRSCCLLAARQTARDVGTCSAAAPQDVRQWFSSAELMPPRRNGDAAAPAVAKAQRTEADARCARRRGRHPAARWLAPKCITFPASSPLVAPLQRTAHLLRVVAIPPAAAVLLGTRCCALAASCGCTQTQTPAFWGEAPRRRASAPLALAHPRTHGRRRLCCETAEAYIVRLRAEAVTRSPSPAAFRLPMAPMARRLCLHATPVALPLLRCVLQAARRACIRAFWLLLVLRCSQRMRRPLRGAEAAWPARRTRQGVQLRERRRCVTYAAVACGLWGSRAAVVVCRRRCQRPRSVAAISRALAVLQTQTALFRCEREALQLPTATRI